jgi:hypothetical protein
VSARISGSNKRGGIFILAEVFMLDVNVYVRDIKSISKSDCEKYLSKFGIIAELHPETNFETDSGVVPFKVEFPHIEFLKDKTFLSGFEFYSDSYDYSEDLKQIKDLISTSSKPRGLLGLFKKKTNTEDVKTEVFVFDRETDELLKQCKYIMTLSVGSEDSFEFILAFVFASYVAEMCGGVVYDTFWGTSHYKDNLQTITDEIKEYYDGLTPRTLMSHTFEGWV